MYKLQEEPSLLFNILWAMDGNNSLPRIIRRSPTDGDDPNVPGPSCELNDSRKVFGDIYIARDDVNKWAQEVVGQAHAASEGVSTYLLVLSYFKLMFIIKDEDYNPCAARWKNMSEALTNRMWGIFDETGVFMAFCRHGFTLVITDMVRSGEQ
jgi:Kyakuja-Dileera-Zisupton transposase